MRISDWSSDVCSSDLQSGDVDPLDGAVTEHHRAVAGEVADQLALAGTGGPHRQLALGGAEDAVELGEVVQERAGLEVREVEVGGDGGLAAAAVDHHLAGAGALVELHLRQIRRQLAVLDRKSTRLNSSH